MEIEVRSAPSCHEGDASSTPPRRERQGPEENEKGRKSVDWKCPRRPLKGNEDKGDVKAHNGRKAPTAVVSQMFPSSEQKEVQKNDYY